MSINTITSPLRSYENKYNYKSTSLTARAFLLRLFAALSLNQICFLLFLLLHGVGYG